MEAKITDLLDQYEDRRWQPSVVRGTEEDMQNETEVIPLKATKHNGWKTVLAAAAALAVVVGGVWGLTRIGSSGSNPAAPGNATTVPNTVMNSGEAKSQTLTEDEQHEINRTLTLLAEQYHQYYDRDDAEVPPDYPDAPWDEYALIRFAYNYYKTYNDEPGIINDQIDATAWETLSLESVNRVLERYLGRTVSPAEGTDYTALRGEAGTQHIMFAAGQFWFPPTDGEMYNRFVLTQAPEWESENVVKISIMVYDGGIEARANNLTPYLWTLTQQQAAEWADLIQTGMARLERTEDGFRILTYRANPVDPHKITVTPIMHGEADEGPWPEEYPIHSWEILDGAFAQTGPLNSYRYAQLPGADQFVQILNDYTVSLIDGRGLDADLESQHDGYSNWFARGEDGGYAAVSGSTITGRFNYSLTLSNEHLDGLLHGTWTSPAVTSESVATEFVRKFAFITGELELAGMYDSKYGLQTVVDGVDAEVEIAARQFLFYPKGGSRVRLAVQDGLDVPIACGDSDLPDLTQPCFLVTVLKDGTVVDARNYITTAPIELAGTAASMPTEADMPKLVSYISSWVEDDTLILESVRVKSFSVYFGAANVYPLLTLTYHLASAPDEVLRTEMVLPGALD